MASMAQSLGRAVRTPTLAATPTSCSTRSDTQQSRWAWRPALATLRHWAIAAALLATFYVNTVSLLLLSAILEKRSHGTTHSGETTTITLPPALIEGTETIVLFTLALAVPAWADTVFVVMALGVVVSVLQRASAARRLLI